MKKLVCECGGVMEEYGSQKHGKQYKCAICGQYTSEIKLDEKILDRRVSVYEDVEC